jgi:hypothetical protein
LRVVFRITGYQQALNSSEEIMPDLKELVQQEIDIVSDNLQAMTTLAGGCTTAEKFKQMTLEEILRLLVPNKVTLRPHLFKDSALYENIGADRY